MEAEELEHFEETAVYLSKPNSFTFWAQVFL